MLVSKIFFYIVVALFVPILASMINALVTGRARAALRALRVYLIVVAVYATVLIATTLSMSIEVLPANGVQYDGDWNITVQSLRRVPHDVDEDYEVDLRLGNRGEKPIQGDKNIIVYLLSENGTRYDSAPEPSSPPFDVTVNPGKFIGKNKTIWSDGTVTTTRKFVLPTNMNRVELIVFKRGLRLSNFLVGRAPFDGRTAILLQK